MREFLSFAVRFWIAFSMRVFRCARVFCRKDFLYFVVRFWVGMCVRGAVGVRRRWERIVSSAISILMVAGGLPLGAFLPQAVYAAGADAVVTGAPSGRSNVTVLDVTVGSDNSVSHYKYDVVAGSVCTGLTLSGSTGVGTKITENIGSSGTNIADGEVSLCVAGSTDGTTFDSTPTRVSWVKDTGVPTIVGGGYSGTSVGVAMSEGVWGSADAGDFTVVNDSGGTPADVVPTGIVQGGSAGEAAGNSVVVLTVPSTTWTGVVKVYYTQNVGDSTKRVKDEAGNVLASVASGSAVALASSSSSAPTATITGAPTGTSSTNPLNVTVGGSGVAAYKHYLVNGTAGVTNKCVEYLVPASAFDSSSGTDFGVAVTENRVYGVERGDGESINAFNRATGVAVSSEDITLHADNDHANGMTTDGTTLWVTDNGDDKVYAYTISSKTRDTSKEFDLDSDNGDASSITKTDTHFYVTDTTDDKVYAYTTAGSRASTNDFSFTTGYTGFGIATDGAHFFVQDNTTARAYTMSGVRAPQYDMYSFASGSYAHAGYDIYDSKLYLFLSTSIAVIPLYVKQQETPVGTAITDNISALADGSVSLCVAGRNGINQWDSGPTAATWTKDTTPPTISSGKYGGTTVKLTMSESVWGDSAAPDANDFTVVNNAGVGGGTDVTPTGISIAATSAAASTTITLTVPTTTWTGTVKAYYTQDTDTTKRAKDTAGNALASLASGSAVTLTQVAAPSVTLTGAPTGTSNTTTLNVTAAGTDLTHYRQYMIAGSSCAVKTAGVVDFGTDKGVAVTTNRVYIAAGGSAPKMRAYTLAGTAVSADDITLHTDNGSPMGAHTDGTTMWVLDNGNDKVYAYTISTKVRDTSKEFDLHTDNTNATAITGTATHFYVVDFSDSNVYVYNTSGTRDTTKEFTIGSGHSTAATDGTYLYVDEVPFAEAYQLSDGARTPAKDVYLSKSSAYYDYPGFSYANGGIYAIGTDYSTTSDLLYTPLPSAETAIATAITTDISSTADGSVSLCAAGKNDIGQWQETPTKVSWTKDATAPTISSVTAAVGSSVAVTMSENVYAEALTVTDFKVKSGASGSEAANTVTSVVGMGVSKNSADNSFTLNLTTALVAGDSVKVYYTKGSRIINDTADNALATVAEADAITTTVPGGATPPNAPTGLDLAAADDTGASSTDNITKNTTGLTITGCAKADSTVTLYKDGAAFSPAVTDTADGATCTNGTDTAGKGFSADIPLSASATAYAITAKATANSQTSAASTALSITVDTTAPTVTSGSTGYYTDNTLGTALSGAVGGGTDIYTKYTFSEVVAEAASDTATARPELYSVVGGAAHTYAGSSADITLDSGNTTAQGVVATATTIYVVDSGSTKKLYAYNLDGTRKSGSDIALDSASDYPYGLAATDTHFLVYNYSGGIRAYTLAGTRDSTKDISDPSNGEGRGIIADSSGIYLVDGSGGASKVYAHTTAGTRNSGGDFSYNTVSYPNAGGITRTADGFYIADTGNNKVLAFSTTGTYDASRSFNLATANTDPTGITALANGDILVADSTDNKLYRYNHPDTVTQYDIISTGSVSDGDCIESGTDTADKKQYTCRYTTASTDSGTFKARAGTATADIAGNPLAATYTHATALTVDTTAPTISSVSATGTTLTITLSEPVYAATAPDIGDFAITGKTLSNLTGLPSTAATADNSFTITLNSALTGSPTLSYTQNSTDSKRIKDAVGNPLSSASDVSITLVAAPNATVTGAPSGSSNTTTLDVTVGSTNGVTHYKYDVVAGTACTGLTLSASTAIATKITEDITSIADGSVSLCVAGSSDGTNFDTTPTKVSWTKDTAAPTISSGTYSGTTITLTLSEAVWGDSAAPDADNFTVVNDSTNNNGTDITPTGITIAATEAAASATITLTVPATTWAGTVKLHYTQDTTATKRAKDTAGNALATITSGNAITLTAPVAKTLSISAVSTDNYINDTEDESDITISGTSTGLTQGTTVTVGVDGSGTDVSGLSGTTDSDGDWSVTLTSDDLKALDATTPDSDGETLTITASATGATSGTRSVVYDPTAPTVSSRVYSATAGGTAVTNVLEGSDIFVKMTFSEAVSGTTANDATARPAIKSKARRNNADTVTEFQYDIIATGDPATEDCKQTGTGDNDKKIYSCRYTTPNTLTGLNDFKAYATDFTDLAGNAGTAETYAGVTGAVAISQTPAAVSISFSNTDGSTVDDTRIATFSASTQFYCANTCRATLDDLYVQGSTCTGTLGDPWVARIGGQSGTIHSGAIYAITRYLGGEHTFSGQFTNHPLPNGTVWYGIPANKLWYKDSNNDNACTPVPETGATITVAYKLAMTLTAAANTNGDIFSVSAADADSGTTTWKYKLLTSTQTCNATTMASGTSDYTEGDTIAITGGTASNGKKACFKVTDDESTPRTEYKAATVSGLTKDALTLTVGSVPAGSAASKDIALTNISSGATVKYKLISQSACTATNYGTGGTSLTVASNAATITVTGMTNNNNYACAQISKAGNTTRYFGSGQITGLTTPEPTVTFSPPEGAGIYLAGDNITVAFSEAIFADSTGTAFTNTTIDDIVSLTSNNEDGNPVAFDATISSNTITIDPTADLSSGQVYVVALSDGWYFGSGGTKTQGSAKTLRTSYGLAVSADNYIIFSGTGTGLLSRGLRDANADLIIANTSNGWYSDTGCTTGYTSTSTDTNYIGSVITLKQSNATGTDIPFTATISDNIYGYGFGQNHITINPTSALSGTVYLKIDPTAYKTNSRVCRTDSVKTQEISFAVDTTAPTISSTAYYSEAAGTNTLSSTTGADEIYTIVTFSEKQRETVSDTIGLPRIAYRVGSAGTETEYDIIASDGTLASGDCKETGTLTNDGKIYTCRYDTTGTPSGDFKTYTKTYKDTAGNAGTAETYATNTGKVAVVGATATLTISAVSTDDYINDTEDESDITISGTSTGLTSGDTVTVGVDGSGTDVSGLTGTTDSDGDWSVTLTSENLKALDATTPDADGETLTVTAQATGATDATRTVTYDPTAPTISAASFVAGSTITVVMSEPVSAATTPTAADFKVKSGASGSETANVVTGITGLPTANASADNSLTLTVTTALVSGNSVKVYYTQGTNRVKDRADNELASVAEGSAVDAAEGAGKSLTVSAVSTDDYINDAEDESDITISGTSTGLTSGDTVTVGVDGSGTDVSGLTGTTDSDGDWSVTLTSENLKALDATTPDADGEDLTVTAQATGATDATRTVTYDPTAPTATYTTGTGGGVVSGTDTLLNIGDSVSVTAAFSESVAIAPTVQMKNNGTNLGSAITGVAPATIYTFSGASADTGTSSDPYDFGNPDSTTGIEREALGGGFVYKTTRAFDSLYLHALGTVNAGTAFRARYHTSKPSASTVDSAGTLLWTSNSYRNNVAGGGLMSNVPSGTYFWVYPSASANRALSNRSMTIVSGAGSGDTVSFSSGTLSAQDSAGTNDPYDFGALTGVSGIERETLGSGYVYKTTKPFAVLSALVQGNVQTNGTTTVSGRHHTSKPTAATVSTAGTEFLSTTSTSQNTPIAAQSAIRAIPAGSYFWFHPDKAGWMSNRVLHLTGTAADTSGSVYTATYAVASGTTVTSGNLQYDITNEASVVDTAGNPLAAKAATTIPNVAVDGVAPTITSGTYAETAITLTMSEAVYGTAEANDFTIVNDSGGTPANVTPTAITLAADAATAGTTVSLTAPVTAWTGTVKLYYTQDSNATKRVYDTAGNPLASLASASAITLGETAVSAAFLPADNGYLTALSGNLTIDFSGAVYSDSACATRLTNTTAGNITALKQNNNSGSAITHTASYSTTDNVITLNPSSDFTEGAVAFVSLTNGWYYSVGGTCTQGSAGTATVTVDATAPTVVSGSTGYYSDSGLANALSGSVGAGRDIYTKVVFSEEVAAVAADDATARPELFSVIDTVSGGYEYNAAGDITLDSSNTGVQGVTANASGIYVVDNDHDKVFAYNLDGTRNSSGDFSISFVSTSPQDITVTPTKFYILDDTNIFALNLDGTRGSGDKATSDNGENSLGSDDNGLPYTVETGFNSAAVDRYSGIYGDFQFYVNVRGVSGITYHDGILYIVDNNSDRVLVYTAGGTRQTASEFNLTAGNTDPTSITALPNGDLLVADSADDKLYRYSTAKSVQYDVLASGTPANGDCVESGSGVSDNKQYTCRYTTGSGDNGTFKARAGVKTADRAGNPLGSVYTHATGLTVDTAPPAIRTASAVGTTVTITLSEAAYATSAPDSTDFVFTGGGTPTVSNISGLPTTSGSADTSFTLTLSAALTGAATLAYTQNTSDSKRIKDAIGNPMTSVSGISIGGTNAPSAPTLALQSPATSPGTDSTPTIRVTTDSTQQNGTVQLYSDSGCTTAISGSVSVDAATEDVTTNALTANTAYTIHAKHTNANSIGTCSTTSVSYTYDTALPTITSATFSYGSTVIVTMSEDVYAPTAPSASDFKVKSGTSGSETANAVTAIAGLPSAAASADNSFSLTVTNAFSVGDSVKVYYTKGTNAVKDVAGNDLATLAEASAVAATETAVKTVFVSAVSTDDYINSTEDDSALTISGTSIYLTTGTTVTVGVDGSGTDISGKTGTTDASGNWSVSLTSAEVQALDATTPDSDGETLTITATAPSATSGTRSVVYDPTAPTVSSRVYSATAGGAAVENVLEGSDVFVKLTFSEAVNGVAANNATARPAIKSKAQRNNADTITEFQYDVIASGTPASGDCTQTGTGGNDKKIYSCRYTTPSTLTGWNDFKAYATDFTDLAGNAGTAETYAGVTDAVGINQTPAPPTFTFTVSDGSVIQSEQSSSLGYSVNAQLYIAAGCADAQKLAAEGTSIVPSVLRVGGQNGTNYSSHIASAAPFTGGVHTFSFNTISPALPDGLYWRGVTDEWWYKDSNNDDQCLRGTATGASFTKDSTVPTISSAAFSAGSTIVVTMSEDVYAGTAPAASDFKVKSGTSGSETANVVTGITGLPSAKGSADNSLSLTVTTALVSGNSVKVYYTKGTNAVKDKAGNELATLAEGSAVSASEITGTLAISAVSTDDYINNAEDESAVLIAGTSSGLTTGTSVSIAVDDADAGSAANHTFTATTGSDGSWTTATTDLTSARLKAFAAGDITITASATGAVDTTRTVVYDPTAPTFTSAAETFTGAETVGSTKYLNTGDTVSVALTFAEPLAGIQPEVQFKGGSTNLGGTRTATNLVSYDRTTTGSELGGAQVGMAFTGLVGIDGIAIETLDAQNANGRTYKTTKAFSSLRVRIDGSLPSGRVFKARTAGSKPAYTALNTHGTAMFSDTSDGTASGDYTFANVPSGQYFWFYLDTTATMTNYRVRVDASDSSGSVYTAVYTIAGTETVASGSLKYDVTNESSLKDIAGNAMTTTIAEATIANTAVETTAPTVTSGSTGYYGTYAGGSFSNALSGTLKGGDTIYTKVTFSEDMAQVVADDATARPVFEYVIGGGDYAYDSGASFNLDSENTAPSGITFTGGKFYVVDITDNKVYSYNSDGSRNTAGDFNLASGNGTARGITHTASGFFVVDYLARKVFAYNLDGTRNATADFSIGVVNPRGITVTTTHFYISDTGDYYDALAYTLAGARDSDADIDLAGIGATGGFAATTDGFFAVAGGTVYAYDTDGSRDADNDPTLTSANNNSTGIVVTSEGLFIVDSTNDKVYAYPNATSTQYDIVANGTTLTSGDCHPTSASAATEWACMYTVAGGLDGDFTLAVGSDTGDIAGNSVGAYKHGTKLTLDNTAPTIASASFVVGGAVTVVMSEDVWAGTAPAATDFKVKSGASGSETANVVTGITGLASTKAGADASFALAVTTALASEDSVKVYYTKGTNAVTDEAGNEMATLAEASAVSATDTTTVVPTVAFLPADGGYTNSLSGNLTAGFGESVYTDAACSSAMDLTGATALLSLKSGGATGTDLAKSVLYAGNTILIDPTDTFTDRQVVYMGVSDGWYYKNSANACRQGTAQGALFTVDVTDPVAVVLPVSGGFVNAAEDDGSVTVSAAVTGDTASVAFSISDGESTPDTLTKTGTRGGVAYTETLSNAMSALTLANGDEFGNALAWDDGILAVGAWSDNTGGTDRGAVYLIKDGDNDGGYTDATGSDVITINTNTAGITLANYSYFGGAVALHDGVLAIGADGVDGYRGAVWLIKDGGDGWGSIESADVTKLSNDTAGITLAGSDYFGKGVALTDGLLAVGSYGHDGGKGEVRLIKDGGDHWGSIESTDITKIDGTTAGITLDASDSFGETLSFGDNLLAVGAYQDDEGGTNRGAVYLIKGGTDSWGSIESTDVTKIDSSTTGITLTNGDYFGSDVSLEGGLLAVGTAEDDTGGTKRGAVYLIKDGGNDWADIASTDITKIDSGTVTIADLDRFGSSVALSNGRLASGAIYDDTGGSNRGAVRLFNPVFTATLTTDDFEKDSTPTPNDSKLAEGTITISATPTDRAGNTGSAATGSFTYDLTSPTLSSGAYDGTTITLTMSEGVWGSAEADDFTVVNDTDGTPATVTPTGITIGASAATTSATVSLTVPSTVWTGVVQLYYTHDSDATKRVYDAAGNSVSAIASADAITLTAFALPNAPTGLDLATADDTGASSTDDITKNTTALTVSGCAKANSTVTLLKNGTAFSPAATATANGGTCTNGADTAGKGWSTDISLSGSALPYRITATATSGGYTGAASDALVLRVDDGAPAATIAPISGGYINASEDDAAVTISATIAADTASVAFSITDSDTTPEILTKTGTRGGVAYTETLSDTMSALTLANGDEFGNALAWRDGLLAVGAWSDNTGGTDRGAVYLIKDGDNDDDFSDATGDDVVTIGTNTAGITLANYSYFGGAVALHDGVLAIGADGVDGYRGAVWLIKDGGDGWGSIESADVTKLSNDTAALTLAAGDYFGKGVALTDGLLAVGSYGHDGGKGEVWLIKDGGDHWGSIETTDITKIDGTTAGITLDANDSFGESLSFGDNLLAIGTYRDDEGGSNRGAVYLIDDGGDGWGSIETTDVTKIDSATTGITLTDGDYFGSDVSLGSGLLAVGAAEDDTGGTKRGAVYLIKDGGNGWADITDTDITKIDSGTVTIADLDRFGSAVALADGRLAAGAIYDDTGGSNRGAVRLFSPVFTATLATADFEKDSAPTPNDSKLAEGTITVSATPTDRAGNTGSAATGTFTYDLTVPTLSSGAYDGTTITLTMSEGVWGSASAADFAVTDDGAAVSVTAVSLPSAAGSAALSFSLTLGTAIIDGSTVSLSYTPDGTRHISDTAGNPLAAASVSPESVSGREVVVSPVSGGYINGTEDDSALVVSGTSVNFADGTAITVVFDGAGTDVTKTGNISGDAWSVSLSVSELAGLDAATPNSTGETITVTATANSVPGTTSFIYDPVAPTVAVSAVAGDDIVNAAESAAGITVSGTTTLADTGSDVDLTFTNGGNTVTGSDVAVTGNAWSSSLTAAELILLTDGVITVSATADDAAGNTATAARPFTRDTAAPTAVVTGAPTVASSATTLNVTVAGTDVVNYRHKTVPGSTCTAGGYSGSTAVTENITTDIVSFADGTVILCVIGKDTAGNWQSESAATGVSWVKDTIAPANAIEEMSGPGTVKRGRTAAFTGTTGTAAVFDGDYILFLRDGNEIARSDPFTADPDGGVSWTVSVDGLSRGTHTLTAVYADAAGNRSTSVKTVTLTVTKSGGGGSHGGSVRAPNVYKIGIPMTPPPLVTELPVFSDAVIKKHNATISGQIAALVKQLNQPGITPEEHRRIAEEIKTLTTQINRPPTSDASQSTVPVITEKSVEEHNASVSKSIAELVEELKDPDITETRHREVVEKIRELSVQLNDPGKGVEEQKQRILEIIRARIAELRRKIDERQRGEQTRQIPNATEEEPEKEKPTGIAARVERIRETIIKSVQERIRKVEERIERKKKELEDQRRERNADTAGRIKRIVKKLGDDSMTPAERAPLLAELIILTAKIESEQE